MATMSSAQIISATAFHSKMALPGLPRPAYPAVSGVSGSVSWWSFEKTLEYLKRCWDLLRKILRTETEWAKRH